MCRIEYADDEGFWLRPLKEQRAAKPHKCDDCGREIAKGETYTYGAWKDGEWGVMTVKVCAHCKAAGYWLQKVCGGHLWPGVIEELEEHWDEEWELRSRGLQWLVTAGKQRWQRRGQLVDVATVLAWAKKAVAKVPATALHG